MKASRLSVAAIGFAILVIAIDFAVIRAAFLSSMSEGWGEPGVRLLPHMLADPIFGPGPKGWAVFAFFLLPMIDALLIGVYRLRRRGDRTAGTVGFVIAGSAATLAVFTSCLISPGTAIGMVTPISRPIALASFHALARLFGEGDASCPVAGSCHGMDLRGHLRGSIPDRVLLHPASAGRCHRGAGRPARRTKPADHGSGIRGNNAGRWRAPNIAIQRTTCLVGGPLISWR